MTIAHFKLPTARFILLIFCRPPPTKFKMYAQSLPKVVLSALFTVFLFSANIFSQTGLQMKLQLMPDGESWGVYVKPEGISPSGSTITSSGQVTMIMPQDFEWQNLESVSGNWVEYWMVPEYELLPGRKIISFGLWEAEPLYPINIEEGEETLLFKFSSTSPCPDTLYLIDCLGGQFSEPNPNVCTFCLEHPDNPCHGWIGPYDDCWISTPNNFLKMLDLGSSPPQEYDFEGNYDLSAWNCNDCDDDGILDAFDDEYSCSNREKLDLKLSYNSIYESWSIMATPGVDFLPTENSILESARLTIVSSDDFEPNNIHSLNGGDWELISEFEEDDIRYFTFELQADLEPIDFEYGQEVKFFRFKNELGDCPESLSILEGSHPANVHANELYGISMEGAESVEVGFGETYGPNAWQCEIILGGGFGLDSLGTSEPVEKMYVSPNPASDFVHVNISAERPDIQSTIKLISLRGQTLQTHLAEGQNTLQLNLNHLPAGLYILTLEREGRVVQRGKLIKK